MLTVLVEVRCADSKHTIYHVSHSGVSSPQSELEPRFINTSTPSSHLHFQSHPIGNIPRAPAFLFYSPPPLSCTRTRNRVSGVGFMISQRFNMFTNGPMEESSMPTICSSMVLWSPPQRMTFHQIQSTK